MESVEIYTIDLFVRNGLFSTTNHFHIIDMVVLKMVLQNNNNNIYNAYKFSTTWKSLELNLRISSYEGMCDGQSHTIASSNTFPA